MGILTKRLDAGAVICAEGYLFELERRGYLQAGAFVPEVVLDFPDAVLQLHREFLRAGSDVSVAFTYYAHRDKMSLIGKEHLVEPLQKNALELARKAAAESDGDIMVCGNICNTNIYDPEDKSTHDAVRQMFAEQVAWAADANVDFMLVETLSWYGEALIGLEEAKKAGVDVVINLVCHSTGMLRDGMKPADACKMLEDNGADVVGLNCNRGPATMLPLLGDIRANVSCHVAGIPVPYRTNPETPTFQSLKDPHGDCCRPQGMSAFPVALDALTCTRYEMADFTRQCVDQNVQMVGVCCGGAPHHVRSMAEELGRTTEASKYSPDMSKHYALGGEKASLDINSSFKANL